MMLKYILIENMAVWMFKNSGPENMPLWMFFE